MKKIGFCDSTCRNSTHQGRNVFLCNRVQKERQRFLFSLPVFFFFQHKVLIEHNLEREVECCYLVLLPLLFPLLLSSPLTSLSGSVYTPAHSLCLFTQALRLMPHAHRLIWSNARQRRRLFTLIGFGPDIFAGEGTRIIRLLHIKQHKPGFLFSFSSLAHY